MVDFQSEAAANVARLERHRTEAEAAMAAKRAGNAKSVLAAIAAAPAGVSGRGGDERNGEGGGEGGAGGLPAADQRQPAAGAAAAAEASLRVRLPDGGRPLVLRLPAGASLGQLYEAVSAHRAEAARASGFGFELRTVAPNRTYPSTGAEAAESLASAGLTPSAALILRLL